MNLWGLRPSPFRVAKKWESRKNFEKSARAISLFCREWRRRSWNDVVGFRDYQYQSYVLSTFPFLVANRVSTNEIPQFSRSNPLGVPSKFAWKFMTGESSDSSATQNDQWCTRFNDTFSATSVKPLASHPITTRNTITHRWQVLCLADFTKITRVLSRTVEVLRRDTVWNGKEKAVVS